VTRYGGETLLLIDNPINRYLLNAPMLPELKKIEDGSLTIDIHRSKTMSRIGGLRGWSLLCFDETLLAQGRSTDGKVAAASIESR
jgi:hypothetical protein